MPIALWLGTREYSRIWRHGSAETFKVQEVMGTLVDGCMSALSDALSVYCYRFTHATIFIVQLS